MRVLLAAVLVALTACTIQAATPSETRDEKTGRPQIAGAAVTVGPHDSLDAIQDALDNLSPGQTLRMAPGRYVGLALTLRSPGITIEAVGAVMDGAALEIAGSDLVPGYGGLAYAGLPAPLEPFEPAWLQKAGRKEAPTPELQAREVLWVCDTRDALREDCVRYDRKPPGGMLRAREFATKGHTLLVGKDGGDWSGRVLLWPQVPEAITCTAEAEGVTIHGLTVRRYAPAFHFGQVDLRVCRDATLVGVSIIESSSIGIRMGDGFHAIASRFDDNGQMGASGYRGTFRFENASASRNNTRGFPSSWNAGGVKVSTGRSPKPDDPDFVVSRLIWLGGEVAENNGEGLWTDGSASDPLIRGALVRDNAGDGVHIELTYGGLVEDNLLRGNGRACNKDRAAGSAIKLHNSEGVAVRGNLVVVETPCGRGIMHRTRDVGHWQTKRNRITGNTVVLVHPSDRAYATGFWMLSTCQGTEERTADNRYDGNRYVVAEGDQVERFIYEGWDSDSRCSFGSALSLSQWQARGFDSNSEILRVTDPAAWLRAQGVN